MKVNEKHAIYHTGGKNTPLGGAAASEIQYLRPASCRGVGNSAVLNIICGLSVILVSVICVLLAESEQVYLPSPTPKNMLGFLILLWHIFPWYQDHAHRDKVLIKSVVSWWNGSTEDPFLVSPGAVTHVGFKKVKCTFSTNGSTFSKANYLSFPNTFL